jgi:glycerophosphoryl diester phosphodiesterase
MRLSLFAKLDRLIVRAPDPSRIGWLREHTFAHRGLHGDGRVENGPAAFRAAVEAGVGIECDIQRSADDFPMVFHDWDFARLIGRPDGAAALTAAEWNELRYLEGGEGPWSFPELLKLVDGGVPLLIEIKSRRGYDVEVTCRRVADALAGYRGLHAVMSFDPRVSRWLRTHSPQTVRGLVMREDDKGYTQKAWQRHLALWIARPEFIAYHVRALPSPMVTALRERMPVLTWTVNSPETRAVGAAHADALIAEGAGLE